MTIHVMRPTPNEYGPTTGVAVGDRTYRADDDGLFRVPDEVAVALAMSGWETVSVDTPDAGPAVPSPAAPDTPEATPAQPGNSGAPKRRTRVAKTNTEELS